MHLGIHLGNLLQVAQVHRRRVHLLLVTHIIDHQHVVCPREQHTCSAATTRFWGSPPPSVGASVGTGGTTPWCTASRLSAAMRRHMASMWSCTAVRGTCIDPFSGSVRASRCNAAGVCPESKQECHRQPLVVSRHHLRMSSSPATGRHAAARSGAAPRGVASTAGNARQASYVQVRTAP